MIVFDWSQFDPASFTLGVFVGAIFLVACAVLVKEHQGKKQ